jgi:hypothetical protein
MNLLITLKAMAENRIHSFMAAFIYKMPCELYPDTSFTVIWHDVG